MVIISPILHILDNIIGIFFLIFTSWAISQLYEVSSRTKKNGQYIENCKSNPKIYFITSGDIFIAGTGPKLFQSECVFSGIKTFFWPLSGLTCTQMK
jgi:hypothetical protein